jgi:hypothetical protein
LSLAGTVILALLGGLGSVVAAQTEEEPAPAAMLTGGTLSRDLDVTEMEVTEGDGVEHYRGFRFVERHEWSDPRLPIESLSIQNGDIYEAGVAFSAAVLLEGPDGYWTGTNTYFCDNGDICHGMTHLTGHEAYEGLSALIASASVPGAEGQEWESEGLIFEGEMPPFPEPLKPVAE